MASTARTSVTLSVVAIVSAVLGWAAFARAVALSNHFKHSDSASGWLLLLWAVLGLVALGTWIAACVTALRARRANPLEARRATTLAILAPGTWAVEFGVLILWFGYEALSGPWPH
jgi:Kef-type K+ transport system membrane component KefB